MPGLSSSSVSLSCYFPLVPFSRLPCLFFSLFLIRYQQLNKKPWAKLGCWWCGCADGTGGTWTQVAMRSTGSAGDGNPSALGRGRGW